jgi:hypothetical protein
MCENKSTDVSCYIYASRVRDQFRYLVRHFTLLRYRCHCLIDLCDRPVSEVESAAPCSGFKIYAHARVNLLQNFGGLLHCPHRLGIQVGRLQSVDLHLELQLLTPQLF